MKRLGLYIHAPFCFSKCPYCDFYSIKYDEHQALLYCEKVCDELERLSEDYGNYIIDTVYFGGGTPNLLGEGLISIINTVRRKYNHDSTAEITVEANPYSVTPKLIAEYADAGVNRFSFGMQSANTEELKSLGRRHSLSDIERAVSVAKSVGADVSLDIMLAILGQTKALLQKTVDFAKGLNVDHISAYMLKIENGTPFYKMQQTGKLILPNDDIAADMYIFLCDTLAKAGYLQYEISNFSKLGHTSKHNLKYWNSEEYLGIGPSAHSFINGKRFFYPDSLDDFMKGCKPEFEDNGGGFAEYVMLKLRLTEGILYEDLSSKYPEINLKPLINAVTKLPAEYLYSNEYGLRFTSQGFLVSNALISMLLSDYL